jgi:hypothetical protein
MVQESSNNATEYVVDRLSGTTGGPELADDAMAAWGRAAPAGQPLADRSGLARAGWLECLPEDVG